MQNNRNQSARQNSNKVDLAICHTTRKQLGQQRQGGYLYENKDSQKGRGD